MKIKAPLPSQGNNLFSDRAQGTPATEQFRPAPTAIEPAKEFRQRDQSAGRTHVRLKNQRERRTTRPR